MVPVDEDEGAMQQSIVAGLGKLENDALALLGGQRSLQVRVIVCPWSTVHIEKAKPATYRSAVLRTSLFGVMPD